jgi:DNA topoisomerase IA
MSKYESIDYFLANYMDVNIGYSEEEVMEELKEELEDSDFRTNMETDLMRITKDKSFSWKALFQEFNVKSFESEELAKEYANRTLFRIVFFKQN